jgi:hypothetical protein
VTGAQSFVTKAQSFVTKAQSFVSGREFTRADKAPQNESGFSPWFIGCSEIASCTEFFRNQGKPASQFCQ